MSERTDSEPRMTYEMFGREFAKKGFPIGEEGAARFGQFLASHNLPQGFLQKIVQYSEFIDEEKIESYFTSMAETAKEVVGTSPYYVSLHHSGRSGEWVYNHLLARGLRPAEALFAETVEEGDEHILPINAIDTSVPDDATILLVDDWSIRGDQITDQLGLLPTSRKPHVLLFLASAEAKKMMKDSYPGVTIHTARADGFVFFDSVLTSGDRAFMEYLYGVTKDEKGENGDKTFGTDNALLTSVHKTPDTIPNIFTGERLYRGNPIPPLILPVKPPYEK